MKLVTKTELPIPLYSRGKVRDTYLLGENLLMVTTDRLSAFDIVLSDGIPYKGAVLNQLSAFWFKMMEGIIPNHMVSINEEEFLKGLEEYADILRGRSMLARKAVPFKVECIVRGYLAGSGWREYERKGTVCGISLPKGLKMCDALPEPIFTPSTKASEGHDVNISFEEMKKLIGDENAHLLKEKSIEVYEKAADYARKKGIIIADTKMEFGTIDDQTIIIDELLTPDSSRFWPAVDYEPGRSQKSFDKQYVRDYLEAIGWNKTPPAPKLPKNVIENTSRRYLEAYERLVGKRLVVG